MAGSATGTDRRPQTVERAFAGGWTTFAAIMLLFGGIMAVLEGIAAIANDDLVVVTRHYTYSWSTTGWGWIHLILGIILVLAGTALFSGAAWARAVGVVVAGLGMIANFLWLPHYPFRAIVLITINAFVIWALCAGTTKQVD
ncbi:hypothetical protein ACIRVF_33585 [Kitasatospora sp. NPDC101157]|uniref:DUF7144 family membrane protein n=1 Tax=Kitasatospora sp. NPDC101157 TaxID=3364098 RepID=UPI0037F2BC4B